MWHLICPLYNWKRSSFQSFYTKPEIPNKLVLIWILFYTLGYELKYRLDTEKLWKYLLNISLSNLTIDKNYIMYCYIIICLKFLGIYPVFKLIIYIRRSGILVFYLFILRNLMDVNLLAFWDINILL